MKELIRNWLALPGVLWSVFVYLVRASWERRGRSDRHNCTTCKHYTKRFAVKVNWSSLLGTKNRLITEIDKEGSAKEIEQGHCSLGHQTDAYFACKQWSDTITEEERIVGHNW